MIEIVTISEMMQDANVRGYYRSLVGSRIVYRIVQFPMTLSDSLGYFAYCILLNAFLARRYHLSAACL